MATMMKEKRKEKKKSNVNSRSRVSQERSPQTSAVPLTSEENHEEAQTVPSSIGFSDLALKDDQKYYELVRESNNEQTKMSEENLEKHIDLGNIDNQHFVKSMSSTLRERMSPVIDPREASHMETKSSDDSYEIVNKSSGSDYSIVNVDNNYGELAKQLKILAISESNTELPIEDEFESPQVQNLEHESSIIEDVEPSAPYFEEIPQSSPYQNVILENKPKVKCMPIEDVMRLFSGGEMENVKAMSEKEEEIVEAGPVSGPEHPLVDLLSTFRSSLLAVERERITLANGFANEEKTRLSLWKVEKRQIHQVEKCACGANVVLRATYQHARLAKEKLPVAKMRLESLLREVQDSYCHHQHTALLAYYQIEELISETIKSNKPVIREALSLILGALRLSASALDALTSALQRWAVALATALVDHRDLRQLLFILHHLFKQSRSVRWASRVLKLRVDVESPVRVLAVLELLLAKQPVDTAQECVEDADEVWEEVDKHGAGSAVSEGALRERDLLSLLYALPVRDLVARILLFTHSDIKQARPHEWGDSSGGRGVLRTCYGVRALLQVLQRATSTHATYARLRQALRDIAARALHGLAYLHIASCQFYALELREKLHSELEACFYEGLRLFESRDVHRLPATLLDEHTARHYCLSHIEQLHDSGELSCMERVRIVCQASVDREYDHELARIVLEFLLQSVKRKPVQSKCSCDAISRDCIPTLLAAHPYLHTIALHILADINMVEQLDVSCLTSVHVHVWRPSTGELRAILDDWARRCPVLLQRLLQLVDCTPHVGLPLDVQLSIGAWLCTYVRTNFETSSSTGNSPEWCWTALRRLRTHRSWWGIPLDAPRPEDTGDLFSLAYALLSSSWGHCIPVICSEGVAALSSLCGARPRDALHCLSALMLVMAHSPESLALTPQFSEVFSRLLSWAPSLVARTLGRGGHSGPDLLLRLMLAQLEHSQSTSAGVLSAWLHALWRPALPVSALALADSAACAVRLWPQIGAYCDLLLQEENASEHINRVVTHASTAPLLCECLLRATHAQHDTLVHYGYGRLLNALQQQRAAGQRIHVDNALQKVSANLSSEELVIYRAATAALTAPMCHPSHLTLWRLVIHLYLQRAPDYPTAQPIGPLFFSGLIKSRTLSQLRKRLQKTMTYHHNEAESLKASTPTESSQSQSTKSNTRTSPRGPSVVDDLLPPLTIVDLTGESSCSSDLDESDEQVVKEESASTSSVKKNNDFNMITYHLAAEKMLSEYLCLLEDSTTIRVTQEYADIARYIPEHALEEAWKRSVNRPAVSEDLEDFPLPTTRPAPTVKALDTPFHRTVDNILKIKDRSRKSHKSSEIMSPLQDVDFRDARGLVALVDKHLYDMGALAQDWCDEVYRISSLDSKLWKLVCTLRVARPIPTVRQQCANTCAPISFTVPAEEWCIAVDADRGIKDNRASARARVRRLARARPHPARTAAALLSVARRTSSSEAGARVAERAWRAAGAASCGDCAPVRAVLTALVTQLSERWICDNGTKCSQLLSSWGKRNTTSLQQTLCGSLVAPRRLPPADWPGVYVALLQAQLPSHTLFSYLSKFEMPRWSACADIAQRREVLDALVRTVQGYGPTPTQEHHMLVELLGVHSAVVVTSQLLCAHVKECARASLVNKLPHTHWAHVVRAVEAKAVEVPFDQLGHLLRELGVMFWEARTGITGTNPAHLRAYAPHVARLLHALQRAFVAVGAGLSYEPERVAWYSWSSLQESWGAWVSPHAGSLPLLSCTCEDEQYTSMLRHFVDTAHQVMIDCPGTEVYLLQHIFQWCAQTYVGVHTSSSVTHAQSGTQECRVQASSLLAELAKLPWQEHQWFYGNSLQVAVQISTSTDRELTSWCCTVWRHITADTLLRDVGEQLVPRLAMLLYLFTATLLPFSQQLIDNASELPWHRLPERALDEALEQFYRVHHNVAQPYHDLPQFRLILISCELSGSPVQAGSTSARKRSLGVSQWVRAASSPALVSHVHAHTYTLLNTIELLETPLSDSKAELEELLCRAAVIMCIEPAASTALPVWVSWVGSASRRVTLAGLSAATTVTALEHFATLSEASTKAAILCKQGSIPWVTISRCWQQSPWRDASVLTSRARLHAAYACVISHEHAPEQIAAMLHALLSADIHFVDNESIVSVWLCVATRTARASAAPQARQAARGVLARWVEPERRSLLSRVMQPASNQPTARHRALCRYALWSLSPDEASRRSFEAALTTAGGSDSELSTWTSTPDNHKLVVNLAIRLCPKHDNYFQYELQLV